MIGYVRGIVTHLFKESCYVDVHGVGSVSYTHLDVYKRQVINREAYCDDRINFINCEIISEAA